MTFSGDDAVIEEEPQEHKDDNFLSELDQLSLNEDDIKANLQELKELEPGELSE